MRPLVLLLALAACKDSPHITLDGSVDGFGPNCHFDCFSEVQCRDGVAYQRDHVPVPCAEWVGSCPGTAALCASGCDVEFTASRDADWTTHLPAFCRETPVAQVGDSCANECLPTRAVADTQGNVTQQYLACDNGSGTCVAAGAPSVIDYLAPCSNGSPYAVAGATGAISQGAGACLLAWDAANGKTREGYTAYCIGDWECPAGASCDDGVPFLDYPARKTGVCRPGARGTPLVTRLPP